MTANLRETHHRRNGHAIDSRSHAEREREKADSFRWESEVFVLHGENRGDLVLRVHALADFLSRNPSLELKDLAFALNAALPPGGSRLALVAESAVDLQSRLGRVAQRLADPSCGQIKDTRGSYFFDRPLGQRGKLAILFPGEGSQYLNMLADLLPHFPEVREHFARCDRLSLHNGGGPEPISRHIFVPATLSDAERTVAEKELWRLGNAVSSILISEWALYLLLRELGVRPDMVGGHSAGEFSALLAADSIEPDDFFIEQLFALSRVLQSQEDDGSLIEVSLLAIAAGRTAVHEILGSEAGVVVAMDNCPHQTVVACSPAQTALVQERLGARGIVCERLPFRRPYHTQLFEPFLGPIAAMYDRLHIRSPRLALYSCTSGKPFPREVAAIRRLAVSHWASPVEFIRLAQAMYADGARLFIECGPRGNLTSFLQDILRNQSFEAVAVNSVHRSGLTQLNHLVALLAAHHVPLRFEHLYCRRQPQKIAWEASTPASAPRVQTANTVESSTREQEVLRTPKQSRSPNAVVMQQYFGVMEQFLDLEREVMEQFLSHRAAAVTSPPARPLIGEVIRHEAGRELVLRRCMDVHEDLYAGDHTLGGRQASAVDPSQNGLPFMPMAFSMEMMAEAAALLCPGRLVVGMKRVRLQRWIPFDDEPIDVELTARVRSETPNEVVIEIRDLGNPVRPGNSDSAAVVGIVLLSDAYPEPPPPEAFPLTNEGPSRFTPSQLYSGERRLFHGPLFEALDSTDRQGDDGIEGHLRTLPHSGLFRSTPNPDLLLDPLLIDASTHLLGSWHLSQPDQQGRVVLPYELGSVTLYGPRPAVGTRVKCRVRVQSISARQVSHRIDLLGQDGRLWCRLAPADYWRFYWPLEYVDFFRHKERFLLAGEWPISSGDVRNQEVKCWRLDPPSDLCQPVHRTALARVTLSPPEWETFRLLKLSDLELTFWLFGRIAAKDAIRALWFERHGQRLFPADIELSADENGQASARYRGGELDEELPRVAFATVPGTCAAVAAFGQTMRLTLQRRDGDWTPAVAFT